MNWPVVTAAGAIVAMNSRDILLAAVQRLLGAYIWARHLVRPKAQVTVQRVLAFMANDTERQGTLRDIDSEHIAELDATEEYHHRLTLGCPKTTLTSVPFHDVWAALTAGHRGFETPGRIEVEYTDTWGRPRCRTFRSYQMVPLPLTYAPPSMGMAVAEAAVQVKSLPGITEPVFFDESDHVLAAARRWVHSSAEEYSAFKLKLILRDLIRSLPGLRAAVDSGHQQLVELDLTFFDGTSQEISLRENGASC